MKHPSISVCVAHFCVDCLRYLLQCDVRFAERLVLKDGAVKSDFEFAACASVEKGAIAHFMRKRNILVVAACSILK